MDLYIFMPLIFILTEVVPSSFSKAQSSSRSRRVGRRTGTLNGRRGEMDDDFDVSVVVDRRVPEDNQTPGHRDVALASLEILVAGEKPPQPTTPKPKTPEATQRPLPPCRNGGIRLLGSFCYCPPKFMGRYCEIYRFNSSCGLVPHGRWVYLNCNSCHCVAGTLKCHPHRLPGCDSVTEEKTTVSPPELDLDLNKGVMADFVDHGVIPFNNSALKRYQNIQSLILSSILVVLLTQLLIRTTDR